MTLNFYSIRFLIIILILFPMIVKYINRIKNNKSKEKYIDSNDNKKKIPFLILIISIVSFIIIKIIYYPYENIFVNFNNSDDVFKYYNPSCKIVKKIEKDNYVYYIYKKRGETGLKGEYYVQRKGWHLDLKKEYGENLELNYTITTLNPSAPIMHITKIYKKKIYIIINFVSEDGIDISDSKDSKTTLIQHDMHHYQKLIILDENKLNKDNYYIQIQNNKYFIFKNNK